MKYWQSVEWLKAKRVENFFIARKLGILKSRLPYASKEAGCQQQSTVQGTTEQYVLAMPLLLNIMPNGAGFHIAFYCIFDAL